MKLWLGRDPTPLGAGEPELEGDLSRQILLDQQAKRRNIVVEDFELTRVRIHDEGVGMVALRQGEEEGGSERAALRTEREAELAVLLRLPAGAEIPFGPGPVKRLAAGKEGFAQSLLYYEDILPVDASYGLPLRLSNPGIYEFRFRLVLRSETGSKKTETIEAAIRVNAVGLTFESSVLHYETRRVRDE